MAIIKIRDADGNVREILAIKGDKGDKGDPFTYDDFTEEQIEGLASFSDERISNAEKRLTNLEKHVSPEYFVTDETVAYEKSVPTNACPYAEIESIGGMTHKVNVPNNLIPFPYKEANGAEKEGLTFTYDNDGVITISGTNNISSSGYFTLADSLTLSPGTYTLSGFENGGGLDGMRLVEKDEYDMPIVYEDLGAGISFTITKEITFELSIGFNASDAGSPVTATIRPMLNVGSSTLPYERYREGLIDTPVTAIKSLDAEGNELSSIVIPEAVRELEYYGNGFGKYSNTVDFGSRRYFKNVEVVEFNGTESWREYKGTSGFPNGLHCYQLAMPEKKIATQTSLCSHFINRNRIYAPEDAQLGYYSDNSNYNPVYFISDKETLTEWKAWLKEQNDARTPVTLVYALAEPTDEDISDKLGDIDNLIEVSKGGTIVFENEGKRGAHSTVTYMLEEVTA